MDGIRAGYIDIGVRINRSEYLKEYRALQELIKRTPLRPDVELNKLHEFNRVIAIKDKDWTGLVRRVQQNPLKPTYDGSSVALAKADLEGLRQSISKEIKGLVSINSRSLDETSAKIMGVQKQLASLKQSAVNAQINTKISHVVEGDKAARQIESAFTRSNGLLEKSIAKAFKQSFKAGSGGGLLGRAIKAPFALPAAVARNAFVGASEELGRKVTRGISAPVDKALGNLGLQIEKYSVQRANEYAVAISKLLGFKNTREARGAVEEISKNLDVLYSPRKQAQVIRTAEKRVSSAAQDAATKKEKFFTALTKEYQVEVDKISNAFWETLGRATQPGRKVAGIGLRINKDVQIAKQSQRIDDFASQIKVNPHILEKAKQTGNLTVLAPGLQGMEGQGGLAISAMLRQFTPNAATVISPNYDMDAKNPRYRRLQKLYNRTVGRVLPMDIETPLSRETAKIGRLGTGGVKSLENQLLGSNDALRHAATAKAYQNAGFDGNVNFFGYSAGVADAQEATRILQKTGTTNVKGFGVGGVVTGLGLRPMPSFTQVQGGRDWTSLSARGDVSLFEDLDKFGDMGAALGRILSVFPKGLLKTAAPGAQPGTVFYPNAGAGHKLASYLADPSTQGVLDRERGYAPNRSFIGMRGAAALQAEKDLRAGYTAGLFPDMSAKNYKSAFYGRSAYEPLIKTAQRNKKLSVGRTTEEYGLVLQQLNAVQSAINTGDLEEIATGVEKAWSLSQDRARLYQERTIITPPYSVISKPAEVPYTDFQPKNYQVLQPESMLPQYYEPPKGALEKAQEMALPLVEFATNAKETAMAVIELGKGAREAHDQFVAIVRGVEDVLTLGQAKKVRGALGDRLKNNWGVELTPYRPVAEQEQGGLINTIGNAARGVYGGLDKAENLAFDALGMFVPRPLVTGAKKAIQIGGVFAGANTLVPGIGGAILGAGGALGTAAGTGIGGALAGGLTASLPGWAAGALGTGITGTLGTIGGAVGAGGAALLAGNGALNIAGKVADTVLPGDSAGKAGGSIVETIYAQIVEGISQKAKQLKGTKSQALEGLPTFNALPGVTPGGFVNRFGRFRSETAAQKRELEELRGLTVTKVSGHQKIQPGVNQNIEQYIKNLSEAIVQAKKLKVYTDEQKKVLNRDIGALNRSTPGFDANAARGQVGAIGKAGVKGEDFLRLVKAQLSPEKVGEFIRQGIEQGASPAAMMEAGAMLAKAYHVAFADELEIRSPSRRFIRYMGNVLEAIRGVDTKKVTDVGKDLGEKLGDGFRNSVDEIGDVAKQVDLVGLLTRSLRVGGGGVGGFIEGLLDIPDIGKTLQGGLLTGGTLAVGAIALPQVVALGNAFANVAEQQNVITRGLRAVVGSGAEEYYDRLAKQANELGVSLQASASAAVGVEASFRNTSLEGQGLSVLEGFQTSIRDFGLGDQQQESVFYGISKAARQGKLQLDEFNLVVENLPGALQALADSYGVSTAQIYQMITAGQILSEDALPRLSQQLKSQSGLSGAGDSATASFTRLSNQLQIVQAGLGELPLVIKKFGADVLVKGLEMINAEGSILGTVLKTVTLGLAAGLVVATGAAAVSLAKLVLGIGAVKAGLVALGAATPVLAGLTVVITAGALAWQSYQRAMDAIKPPAALLETENRLDRLAKKLKELRGEAGPQEEKNFLTGVTNFLSFGFDGDPTKNKVISRDIANNKDRVRAQKLETTTDTTLQDFADAWYEVSLGIEEAKKSTEERKEIEAQILMLRTKQASATNKGDADEARELLKRITELQASQNELSNGSSLGAITGGLSQTIEDLEKAEKDVFQRVIDGGPQERKVAAKASNELLDALDTAKELQKTLTEITKQEPTNFKKINFELTSALSQIDALRSKQERQSSQQRASTIAGAGIGTVAEQGLSRDLARQGISDLKKQQQLDQKALAEIEKNLEKIDPKDLQLFTQILLDLGKDLDTASGQDIQNGIEELSKQNKALPDDAIKILGQAGGRSEIRQRINQASEQIAQSERDLGRSALDIANAQTDYLRQVAATNREIALSIQNNERQLKRQFEDIYAANKALAAEISVINRGYKLKNAIRASAGTFASTLETQIVEFFQLLTNSTKNALDTASANRALQRSLEDLTLGQDEFERGIYTQQLGLADAQAERAGVAKSKPISLVDFAYALKDAGFTIKEHEQFGGVSNIHRGPDHYNDNAIDITDWRSSADFDGGVSSAIALGRALNPFEGSGVGQVIDPSEDPGGHPDHVHLAGIDGMINITAEMAKRLQALGVNLGVDTSSSGAGASAETRYGHKRFQEASRSELEFVNRGGHGLDNYLQPEAAQAVKMLIADAARQGITLGVGDAHRTISEQEQLFQSRGGDAQAARSTAPGGFSEHHTGFVVDFVDSQGQLIKAGTPAYDFLVGQASKAGFEQSFKGQGSVVEEPWHWRFAGSSRAQQALGLSGGNAVPAQRPGISIDALREAIIGKESSGNSTIQNRDTGVAGLGQVLPENIGPWTREALGRSLSLDEFLGDTQAQIKTINFKLNEYLGQALGESGGNMDEAIRRVASKWYSGQSDLFDSTRPQGEYPSISAYTTDILSRYRANPRAGQSLTGVSTGFEFQGVDTTRQQAAISRMTRGQQQLNIARENALRLTADEDARRALENLNLASVQQRQQRRAQRDTQSQATDLRVLQRFPQSSIVGGLAQRQQAVNQRGNEARDLQSEQELLKRDYEELGRVIDTLNDKQSKVPDHLRAGFSEATEAIMHVREETQKLIAENDEALKSIAGTDTVRVVDQALQRSFDQQIQTVKGSFAGIQGLLTDLDPSGRSQLEQELQAISQQFSQQRYQSEIQRIDLMEDIAALRTWADLQEQVDPVFAQKLRDEAIRLEEAAMDLKNASDLLTPEAEGQLLSARRLQGNFEQTRRRQEIPDQIAGIENEILRASTGTFNNRFNPGRQALDNVYADVRQRDLEFERRREELEQEIARLNILKNPLNEIETEDSISNINELIGALRRQKDLLNEISRESLPNLGNQAVEAISTAGGGAVRSFTDELERSGNVFKALGRAADDFIQNLSSAVINELSQKATQGLFGLLNGGRKQNGGDLFGSLLGLGTQALGVFGGSPGLVVPSGFNALYNGGMVKNYTHGGTVEGLGYSMIAAMKREKRMSGRTPVPLVANDGEGILSVKGMRALGGEPMLNMLNKGSFKIPTFDLGGAVSPPSFSSSAPVRSQRNEAENDRPLEVRTTVINNVEYATKSDLVAATQQAAQMGERRAFNKLRGSVNARRSVGL